MVTRILFLGTPQFAVPSLEALIRDSRYEVAGVITQPDRPAGRGLKVAPPPVKLCGEKNGVATFQFPSLRKTPEALELLKKTHPDICVVVAFGQILIPEFFEYPRLGTLNVHASLLPAYRGAAPIVHSLLHGETTTGVTIMKIDAGMDTGDILTQKSVVVPEEMTAGELEMLLAKEGAELLVETAARYVSGQIVPCPQKHELATYAPRIVKNQALIDWQSRAEAIHNQIRAFNPWPGAFFVYEGQPVKVWRSEVCRDGIGESLEPGTLVRITDAGIVIQCGHGTVLTLKELQLPGRKRITARDFANGCQLEEGGRFD